MSVKNARDEFLDHIRKVDSTILCASLARESFDEATFEYREIKYVLKTEFNGNDYDEFLKSLDFQYDAGFGGQLLFGTIFYANGTWSERGEYDGSEWWVYKTCPEIPKECLTSNETEN